MLFDEIEKAHPDVWNILLQILEDGQITDSLGRKVDFRNTIIIMTSNVGAELVKRNNTMGFGTADPDAADYEAIKEKLLAEAKKVFKPEFLNRLTDIIVFHTLTRDNLTKIVELEIKKVSERLRERKIIVKVTQPALDFLIEKGYDPQYGARPLRRAIERFLEDPLAEEIIRGTVKEGSLVAVDLKGTELTFTPSEPSDKAVGTKSA